MTGAEADGPVATFVDRHIHEAVQDQALRVETLHVLSVEEGAPTLLPRRSQQRFSLPLDSAFSPTFEWPWMMLGLRPLASRVSPPVLSHQLQLLSIITLWTPIGAPVLAHLHTPKQNTVACLPMKGS